MLAQQSKSLSSFNQILNLGQLKSNMTYKDLKIECIVRGIDFDTVVKSDFPNLSQWLLKNIRNVVDKRKLIEFDDYVENILRKNNNEHLIHPSLRLSYINDSKVISTKLKKNKKTKKVIEKDKNGIKKHTKKSLTFRLQGKGYSLKKVTKRVLRRYPDANVKSIKIWFRKSERTQE